MEKNTRILTCNGIEYTQVECQEHPGTWTTVETGEECGHCLEQWYAEHHDELMLEG